MDTGEEKVEDAAIAAQLKRQARKVYIESIGAAVAVTLALVLVPQLR